MISAGEGPVCFSECSENRACSGIAPDDPRARENVSRREANPLLEWGVGGIGGGDEGRLDGDGEGGS